MKLVNTHVMNVKGIGNVLENFMMYNSRMDAIPYGYFSNYTTYIHSLISSIPIHKQELIFKISFILNTSS